MTEAPRHIHECATLGCTHYWVCRNRDCHGHGWICPVCEDTEHFNDIEQQDHALNSQPATHTDKDMTPT